MHVATTQADSRLLSLYGSMLANNTTLQKRRHGGSLQPTGTGVASITTLQVGYFVLLTMIGMTQSTSFACLSSS